MKLLLPRNGLRKLVEKEIPSSVVHAVPLGVDTSMFSAATPPPSDKFIFFNCGKWEKRKGHDLLIFLFKEAFKNEPDVELWMMCDNTFLSPEQDAHSGKIFTDKIQG